MNAIKLPRKFDSSGHKEEDLYKKISEIAVITEFFLVQNWIICFIFSRYGNLDVSKRKRPKLIL